ncbi:hypothetical protein C8C94_4896 [Acidovorax sp. 94]|nr:hypothetical protein C8C94_4896 [Acidovorax sp. 94]
MVLCRSGSFGLENVRYPFGLSLSKPGRAGLKSALVLRAEAGLSPRRATHFSLLRQRKVSKRKATPSLRPLRCAKGQTCVGAVAGCAAELTARLRRSARTTAASQSTKHGRSDAHATPQPPRRRRSQQGVGHPNIQQPNSHTGLCFARPHLAGASATRCANWAERSNGPYGCPIPRVPFCACREAQGRGGVRVPKDTRTSCTDSPQLFERSAAGAQRVLRWHPLLEHRRLPVAQRRDAHSRVAFSLVTFFWRRKRKLLRSRAHTPAPALKPGTPHRSALKPRLRQAQPERSVETIKNIAAGAY